MRKLMLLFAGLLLFYGQIFAQTRTITGKLTDQSDKPISGASIQIKGSTSGTTSALDGTFSLTIPGTARTLVITSVGYAPVEHALGRGNTVTISLKTQDEALDEVVVVAYGTVKKSEYTGSAAQINADDITNRPISNVTNALVGSAPGIQTSTAGGQPGSGPEIRLRGFSSISASSSPLIVVDGVVYDGGLGNINPDDVESISTLKDASTTALYGSRGANGVIMITTKKGKRNRSQIQFKVTQGITQRALPEYDRVDAFQYYPLMWEAYRNSLAYATTPIPMADASRLASGLYPRFTTGSNAGRQNYNGAAYSDIKQLLGYNPFNVADNAIVNPDGTLNSGATLLYGDDLDWADQATRQGSRGEYGLSYSGGGDKSDYFGSFSYSDEKGFANKSDFKRFSGRVNVNVQPISWFKTGFNISGSFVNSNRAATGGIVNPFYFSRYIAPIYPVYAHNPTTGEYLLDAAGKQFYDYGSLTQLGLPSRPYNTGRHTIAENLWNQDYLKRNIISARTFGEIGFTDYLKFTTNISVDIQDYLIMGYDNKLVGDGAPGGRADRENEKITSYTFNQLLNFNKKFGEHNVSALLGHENYDYTENSLYGFKQGQIVDGVTELPNFATINSTTSNEEKSKIESYFSRLGYDYSGKYFVTGTLRRDGNSKFSKLVRWDNFWSVGAAWRLDKEAFFNAPWAELVKLRASYGKVGNDAGIGNFPYQALYTLGRNNALEPGLTLGGLPNDSLTWETSKSVDVGVDFALFKNRISGSVEYFYRETDGLIFDVPQPLSNGGTTGGALTITQNIGSLWNKGLEVQLNGDIIRSKNFTWNMNINFTTFKNRITKMPQGRKEIIDGTKKLMEGQSIYDFWLRHYYGVDPTDGAALYAYNTYNAANSRILDNGKGGKDTVTTDINNAKFFYTGTSAIPDFYGSVANTFSYKGFDLTFVLTYQVGGQVYDGSYAGLMHSGTYGSGLHTDMLGRWTKPGDITNVPRLDNSKITIYGAQSDRWLTSASYVSINNVNLGYNFPAKWLSNIKATGARIYLSAENVYFFSKRKGMNVNGNFSGTTGDTYNAARVLTAGINFNF
ncbi:SusC/RagA family TonB-linked outer membrane protein [Flavitalea sp.]|nr:SusC/RagA family TonB-linked outer membrane protein [Flavitalea sp.]